MKETIQMNERNSVYRQKETNQWMNPINSHCTEWEKILYVYFLGNRKTSNKPNTIKVRNSVCGQRERNKPVTKVTKVNEREEFCPQTEGNKPVKE